MLLEKGPAYQNDITEITYHIRGNGIESFRKKFKFHLPQAIMDLSCWYYEYYDLIEKKKPCKMYLPYSHFHSRGFTFVYDKNNKYHVGFNETDHLLISAFIHDKKHNVDIYYRDLNVILTFDYIKSLQWFGTSSTIIYNAMNEIITNEKNLT